MKHSCPHCDKPDASLLRLVLIGEILRADESLLVLLADVMQDYGLLTLAEKPKAARIKARKGALRVLRQSGAGDQ